MSGVRGKYAQRARESSNIVLLERINSKIH